MGWMMGDAKILSLRQRAQVVNDWLKERLTTVLPLVMRREGFDMWIVAAREYNEDPVIMSLLPAPAMSVRRRTILVLTLEPDGTVERLTLDRYGYGDFYTRAWDPEQEDQFACLARIVRERNPVTIGLNVCADSAFGDGLTHSEYERIIAALGDDAARVRGAGWLCIGWLERRSDAELTAWGGIVEIGHTLISQAFSRHVIHPGITTTTDVVWWMRQRMLELGLQPWFQPDVEIQAAGSGNVRPDGRVLIQPGDLLHCDVGFYYLGLATDQQQNAYVTGPGESDAPAGLRVALAQANRLQDILCAEMQLGRTGNQVLGAALERARSEGLMAAIYTHPLGRHGHAAGPTIGLWDCQDGVPGAGDYPLFDRTGYAIELNVQTPLPEWGGQVIKMALEEDAALVNGQVRWLAGRQTRLHLI